MENNQGQWGAQGQWDASVPQQGGYGEMPPAYLAYPTREQPTQPPMGYPPATPPQPSPDPEPKKGHTALVVIGAIVLALALAVGSGIAYAYLTGMFGGTDDDPAVVDTPDDDGTDDSTDGGSSENPELSLPGDAHVRGKDTDETWAYIMDPACQQEDLETLLTLSATITQTYSKHAPKQTTGFKQMKEYFQKAKTDKVWPGEEFGFGTPETSSVNPQLWVRLARLAKLQIETNNPGTWHIAGMSYPVDGDGTEGDVVVVTFVGTSAENIGQAAQVSHHRWQDGAPFTEDIRFSERHAKAASLLEGLKAAPELSGLDWLLIYRDEASLVLNDMDGKGTEALASMAPVMERVFVPAGFSKGSVSLAKWTSTTLAVKYGVPADGNYGAPYIMLSADRDLIQACLVSGFHGFNVSEDPTVVAWETGQPLVTGQEMEKVEPTLEYGDPSHDPAEAVEATGILAVFPEQVGNSAGGPYYNYWIRNYGNGVSVPMLRATYAPDGVVPNGVGDPNCIATIQKMPASPSQGLPTPGVTQPKGRTITTPNGTPVTIGDKTDGVTTARWSFVDDGGRHWSYLMFMYEDLDDDSICTAVDGTC